MLLLKPFLFLLFGRCLAFNLHRRINHLSALYLFLTRLLHCDPRAEREREETPTVYTLPNICLFKNSCILIPVQCSLTRVCPPDLWPLLSHNNVAVGFSSMFRWTLHYSFLPSGCFRLDRGVGHFLLFRQLSIVKNVSAYLWLRLLKHNAHIIRVHGPQHLHGPGLRSADVRSMIRSSRSGHARWYPFTRGVRSRMKFRKSG